jgi:hypothetical protein
MRRYIVIKDLLHALVFERSAKTWVMLRPVPTGYPSVAFFSSASDASSPTSLVARLRQLGPVADTMTLVHLSSELGWEFWPYNPAVLGVYLTSPQFSADMDSAEVIEVS